MSATKFYDFTWTFSDGEKVTFAGISRLYDLRERVKDLKRKPEWRAKAERLTMKSMHITEHVFCVLCQPCPDCKRPLHVCAGHEDGRDA